MNLDLTADPMPDIPRLRKAVEWVEAEAARPWPERQWEQGYYVATRETTDKDARAAWASLAYRESAPKSCGTCFCVAGFVDQLDGQSSPYGEVSTSARRLLGLTREEAGALFAAGNSATDVRRIAESIAARVGERL